jgi:hypothetical protein
MAGLAEAMQGAVGQPSSVRIGVVDSVNPLVVSAQGVPFNDVGYIGEQPLAGDSIAMLGQSSEAGSDPASWLALGAVRAADAPVAISRFNFQAALASTTSLAYVATAVVCETPFIAPRTGRVLVSWRGGILTSGAGVCFVAPQIANPDGSLFLGATDAGSINTPFGSTLSFGASTLISNLVPGSTYTATLMQRTSNAASAALAVNREIAIVPAP